MLNPSTDISNSCAMGQLSLLLLTCEAFDEERITSARKAIEEHQLQLNQPAHASQNKLFDIEIEAGDHPIHLAAKRHDQAMCQLLLSKGADLRAKNKLGKTPLVSAILESDDPGCEAFIAWIMDQPGGYEPQSAMFHYGLPTAQGTESGSYPAHPFFDALHRGLRNVAHRMIEDGLPKECLTDEMIDPVSFAATNNDTKAIRLLVAQGFKIDSPDRDGLTPLHHACYEGATIGAQELIKHGANVNQLVSSAGNTSHLPKIQSGITPLMLSIHSKSESTVQLLLDNGASHVNLSPWQTCAISTAIQEGTTPEIVQTIFNARYNDATSEQKNTWLTEAVKYDNTHVIDWLIDIGAQTKTKYNGRSMLQMATPKMRRAIRSAQMKSNIDQSMRESFDQNPVSSLSLSPL